MDKYPEIVTERFDDANFHINYCLKFIKKYLKGNILEVGAGCGSFTKNYLDQIENNKITLTELDKKNIDDLKERFKNNKIPESIDEKVFKGESFDIVFLLKNTGLVRSTSDAFRSIQQGAVRVDGQKVLERELVLKNGCYVLQVGKRRFIRVRVE